MSAYVGGKSLLERESHVVAAFHPKAVAVLRGLSGRMPPDLWHHRPLPDDKGNYG